MRVLSELRRLTEPLSSSQAKTGTGKELAARLVHECSGRVGEFIDFNCATLPKDLMDAELFGYVSGAFSGATRPYPGLFEQASRGTLFLDEIGDMPVELQAKVLRATQEGEIRRLGDTRTRPVDICIVAATHHNLHAMMTDGTFRADLRYRLAGYEVELPPLRARGRDVLLLARHFLRSVLPSKRLSREAQATLLTYEWPRNIRELHNVIRAAGIDAGRTIRPQHLTDHLDRAAASAAARPSLADQVVAVVDRTGSAGSAEIRDELSLPRTTLRRALNKLVATGLLRRVGDGRSIRYARANATNADPLVPRRRGWEILPGIAVRLSGPGEPTQAIRRVAGQKVDNLSEIGGACPGEREPLLHPRQRLLGLPLERVVGGADLPRHVDCLDTNTPRRHDLREATSRVEELGGQALIVPFFLHHGHAIHLDPDLIAHQAIDADQRARRRVLAVPDERPALNASISADGRKLTVTRSRLHNRPLLRDRPHRRGRWPGLNAKPRSSPRAYTPARLAGGITPFSRR